VVKIYTKTGDGGDSALFGGGRVPKNHPRLEAYGTLDELNSLIGWTLAQVTDPDLVATLTETQSRLFDLGAHLATPPEAQKAETILPVLETLWILALEQAIDALDQEIPPLTAFVLPGGNEASSRLHLARVVCRRAERAVVGIPNVASLNPVILPYLNRLSDYLFVAARSQTHRQGLPETAWKPNKPGV
jgi:cob(I)alamin adenosyltransferase